MGEGGEGGVTCRGAVWLGCWGSGRLTAVWGSAWLSLSLRLSAALTITHSPTNAPRSSLLRPPPSHPFCYFPVFYLLKGAVEGRPVAETYGRYRDELWDNCKALWTIWVPAQMVNFTVVPRHLRIPYGEGG